MHRAMAADQVENAFNQRIPTKISKFTQGGSIAEMTLAIGVASRTTQGTFARDFNRKKRNAATQDLPPGTCNVAGSNTGTRYDRRHGYLDASRRIWGAC